MRNSFNKIGLLKKAELMIKIHSSISYRWTIILHDCNVYNIYSVNVCNTCLQRSQIFIPRINACRQCVQYISTMSNYACLHGVIYVNFVYNTCLTRL